MKISDRNASAKQKHCIGFGCVLHNVCKIIDLPNRLIFKIVLQTMKAFHLVSILLFLLYWLYTCDRVFMLMNP